MAGRTETVISVCLIEDHDMVREGLLAMLSSDERFEVVGAAGTLAEFRARSASWQPQVIVTDYRLPDGKGTDLVEETSAAVLLVSGESGPGVVRDAIRSGCAGFVGKDRGGTDLANLIVVVANGGSVFPAEDLRSYVHVDETADRPRLSPRENEVLGLLVQARSVPEIAQHLSLSEHTVRNHVRSLLSKLHARSQLEAVVNAVRAGLVQLGP